MTNSKIRRNEAIKPAKNVLVVTSKHNVPGPPTKATTRYTVNSIKSHRDKDGNWTAPDNYNQNLIFAKKVVAGSTVYYVKMYRGRLYDPFGIDSPVTAVFKAVSRQVFENYLSYLRSRDQWHIRAGNRLLV